MHDGFRYHFRNAIAHWLAVGDWLAHLGRWTGIEPAEALAALHGASPASVHTIAMVDDVAAAVRESPAALAALTGPGEPAARLAAVRAASPEAARRLDAYLAEHGWRIFTGFDVTDLALVELPGAIVDGITARIAPPPATVDSGVAAQLRSQVPAQHAEKYDRLYATARVLYGLRDDDVGPCFHWTSGLARRALLAAGDLLERRGRIPDAALVFDATPAELQDLLLGRPVDIAAIERRASDRSAAALLTPPARLGEDEGPPPPDDWMPPAVARINNALMLAMSLEVVPEGAAGSQPLASAAASNGVAPAPAQSEALILKGQPASRGAYEGHARVIASPDDFARLRPGDILIAPFTTTAYNVVLPLLGGVVTDRGGVLSHAAIVAREYGIPAVVGARTATSDIPDGARVRVDGDTGSVTILAG
jgi:pyruvate,water dikinase